MLGQDVTVELIRTCVQTNEILESYAIKLRDLKTIESSSFIQSMYGPNKDEWPGSPVGFSWEIEFVYSDEKEDTFTFEVLYESEWTISAERQRQDTHGVLETVHTVYEKETSDLTECIDLIKIARDKLIEYCNEWIVNNVN